MMGSLLLRGMLAGAFAGLLVLVFATIFGEPQVNLAIALEEQAAAAGHEHAAAAVEPAGHSHGEEELVLAREVPVDRAGVGVELATEPRHREVFGVLGVGDAERGLEHHRSRQRASGQPLPRHSTAFPCPATIDEPYRRYRTVGGAPGARTRPAVRRSAVSARRA